MTMRAPKTQNMDCEERPASQQTAAIYPLLDHPRAAAFQSQTQLPGETAPAVQSWRKRTFDLVVASLAVLFLAPVMVLLALAIVVETGGPALFRQARTGHRGKTFVILKFRTMTVAECGDRARQATLHDDRITSVGLILRKLSLDELPQLLNVIRGEMSLVGPRPHAVGHDEQFAGSIPAYPLRFMAKPGLTGLAQVRGHRGEIRGPQCIQDRVSADCEYIENWSFALDMQIILRTIPLLFNDPRAY
jgi:putative colanic acid biosynthesis UDP-glucose lipid carrier transferase